MPGPSISAGSTGNYVGFQRQGFAPVHDDLSRGNVVDDWIPTDPRGLHRLWRLIYLRDDVGGPCADLYRELPWSDGQVVGMDDDKKKRQLYEDALKALGIIDWMPEISGEFITMGKVCIHLLWNDRKGFWDNMIIHDPDFIHVEPIPLAGADVKVDLLPSPEIRRWLMSPDPRDRAARRKLPRAVLTLLQRGQPVPLSNMNTIYAPRRAAPYDYIGTSMYTRMLDFIAYQKALINVMVTACRRRAGPVTSITAGTDKWEPSPQELDDIVAMYLSAEADPIGAVLAFREGVNIDRQPVGPGDYWKVSDEDSYLTEGKMRALGINDALLSGDANWSTTESALSQFMNRIKAHRDYLTRLIIHGHIFLELARRHHIVKTTQAELNHRIRYRNIFKEPSDEDLDIPEWRWAKSLEPTMDEDYLRMLGDLEDHGVPIPLRDWAAAGGVDLSRMLRQLPEDIKIRKTIKPWQRIKEGTDEEDTGGTRGLYGSTDGAKFPAYQRRVAAARQLARKIKALGVWRDNRFMDLSQQDVVNAIRTVTHFEGNGLGHRDIRPWLAGKMGWSPEKVDRFHYVLGRAGVPGLPEMSDSTVAAMSKHFFRDGEDLQPIELAELRALSVHAADEAAELTGIADAARAWPMERHLSSDKLLTGVTTH
jgi:hypothetical protein